MSPTAICEMPPISIVGGGIAGLTLGRCLHAKGVPYMIYAGGPHRSHDYFITIHPPAHKALFKYKDTAEDLFLYDGKASGSDGDSQSTRAVDRKLREALEHGQEIHREGFRVTGLTQEDNGQKKLHFENGSFATTSVVVDAGGEHSGLRNLLLPDFKHNVLPYVVYYGSRKLSLHEYNRTYRALFRTAYKIHTLPIEVGSPALQIWAPSVISGKHVYMRYVYSRKSQGPADKLARSSRRTDQAKDIPEELYSEIDGLQKPQPSSLFGFIFDSARMRTDKLLHWLMRSSIVGRDDLESLASRGIVMIGDSAHTMPILGGNGANEAILDAVKLADWLERGKSLERFYQDIYPDWRNQIEECEAAIERYHRPPENVVRSAKM